MVRPKLSLKEREAVFARAKENANLVATVIVVTTIRLADKEFASEELLATIRRPRTISV